MSGTNLIERALLDHDGSCRDVNFDSPSWDGVVELLNVLRRQFETRTASDANGNSVNEPHSETAVSSAHSTGSVLLEYRRGTGIMASIRIFVYREEDGSPFVEFTFFPEDVMQSASLGRDFISWLRNVQECLRARRCYCRYENASWRFGDTEPASGIFFVLDDASPVP